jgi:hypothetical protein
LDNYVTSNSSNSGKQTEFKDKITNGEFLQIYRNPLDEQFSLGGSEKDPEKSNYPIFYIDT